MGKIYDSLSRVVHLVANSELSVKCVEKSGLKEWGHWSVLVYFVKQMSSGLHEYSFKYLPFSTQPNQLKKADFGVFRVIYVSAIDLL